MAIFYPCPIYSIRQVRTGAGNGEQHSVIFRADLDLVACPISLDLETEVMGGRQSETFVHCCISLLLKNLIREILTDPPIKFQLKQKPQIQVKRPMQS